MRENGRVSALKDREGRFGRRRTGLCAVCAALAVCVGFVCLVYGVSHKKYTNNDFNITPYKSLTDRDGDGTDDQTDLLNSVRAYIAEKPRYKSKYYAAGYPDDGYGVCTDVVAFGLRGAGYDLMELVSQDIAEHREDYSIDNPDPSIDFRRVQNLKVFFRRHAIALTLELDRPEEWQGGDIVVFQKHIGIVSDKRNRRGIPFVIHHANRFQRSYEEDILERRSDLVGHYRIS